MTGFRIAAAALGAALPLAVAQPALAAPAASADPDAGAPIAFGDGFSLDPLLNARLRWEDVDLPAKDLTADAVTMRVRAGFAVASKATHLSFLVEGMGNLALDKDYNAFPYKFASSQFRPTDAVVADPQDAALDRLQIQYATKALTVTVGRQRINLDDQRWVGSVEWRQDEQTFDAARVQAALGPVSFDGTYADRQHSIYGADGGPRAAYDGKFWLLGASVKTGPVVTKGFAYLLNYDPGLSTFQNNSSQTYGFRSAGSFAVAPKTSFSFVGSVARQSNYGSNPSRYSADYLYTEAGLTIARLAVKGGYEVLGSDASATGAVRSVQTPMATLHAWDGWADQFLVTPVKGLDRQFVSATYDLNKLTPVSGLYAQVIYHKFTSDVGNLYYGHEWDSAIGFKTGPVKWMVAYADFIADNSAYTDTKKFWLQAGFAF